MTDPVTTALIIGGIGAGGAAVIANQNKASKLELPPDPVKIETIDAGAATAAKEGQVGRKRRRGAASTQLTTGFLGLPSTRAGALKTELG